MEKVKNKTKPSSVIRNLELGCDTCTWVAKFGVKVAVGATIATAILSMIADKLARNEARRKYNRLQEITKNN